MLIVEKECCKMRKFEKVCKKIEGVCLKLNIVTLFHLHRFDPRKDLLEVWQLLVKNTQVTGMNTPL